jgi:hypothetical protein
MKIFLQIIFFFSLVFQLKASELDSFTGRYGWKLKDASKVINEKANESIQIALSKANKKASCSEKNLYKELRKFFKNHYQGKFVPFILNSKDIEKIQTKFDDTIYRDFKWYEAFSLAAVKKLYKNSAAYALNMGGIYIGSDKFEHMFGRGFKYFEHYYLKGKSLRYILKFGHNSEKYFLGAYTTGVYSQGDLAANFNGMRFWNDMLLLRPDILDRPAGPYIECQEEKWVQIKKLNFNHYIDLTFDEATNCSKFRNKNLLNKVLNRIDALEKETGKPHHCPFSSENLSLLEAKYGEYISSSILNFKGHGILKQD